MATQERQIFVVTATVVDANGAYNSLSGYPKSFDSKNSPYNGDIDMALRRATADWHEVIGAMLKRDDRQLQTAVLSTADGRVIGQPFHTGAIAPVVVPDSEPQGETGATGETGETGTTGGE